MIGARVSREQRRSSIAFCLKILIGGRERSLSWCRTLFRESVVVECVFFRACGLINDVSDAVVAWLHHCTMIQRLKYGS